MKKVKWFAGFICILLALSGCGINTTVMNNNNTSITNVELSKKNFVVLGRVDGQASDMYVLGFGGLSKVLYGRAKNDMLQKIKMQGKARAVIDVTFDVHTSFYLLLFFQTVTATGTIIEFTE
jgi:hypothetical protein